MKKITLTFITLTLLAISCNQTRRHPSIPSTLSEIIEEQDIIAFRDTILWGESLRIFGEDSILVFRGRSDDVRQVIYINPAPVGGIRSRSFDGDGNVISIAFTTDRPLHYNYFDSDWYDRSELYSYMDSVVTFDRHSGNIIIGFRVIRLRYMPHLVYLNTANYSVYDSTGFLVGRHINDFYNNTHHIFDDWAGAHFARDDFHPNGNIKRRMFQGSAYVWGVIIGEIEWDSLGRKTRLSRTEFSMPPGGAGHHSLREIKTITDFHPDGTIRQIARFNASAEGAPECPCGEWVLFDERGIEVYREMYAPCEDFLGGCDEDLLFYRNTTLAEAYQQFLADRPEIGQHLPRGLISEHKTFTSGNVRVIYSFWDNRISVRMKYPDGLVRIVSLIYWNNNTVVNIVWRVFD